MYKNIISLYLKSLKGNYAWLINAVVYWNYVLLMVISVIKLFAVEVISLNQKVYTTHSNLIYAYVFFILYSLYVIGSYKIYGICPLVLLEKSGISKELIKRFKNWYGKYWSIIILSYLCYPIYIIFYIFILIIL